MVSATFANRIIFIFSLLGLAVAAFLAYEYSLTGPVICPIAGGGCDTVRASTYSNFLGISIPLLGVAYYLAMAGGSIVRTHNLQNKLFRKLQILAAFSAFAFGVYLTYLEAFVILAYCFWCVTSFIISAVILLFTVLPVKKREIDEN